MEHIYLDHAATTPVHPEVIEAMIPVYTEHFGNPSSIHSFGRDALKQIEDARAKMANIIGAKPREIIFTGGGTEADNLAIIGVAYSARQKNKGNHIITTKIEHHAVLKTCEHLEKEGFEVTYLDVDQNGRINLQDVKEAIRPETILISVMYGNNEVGTLQPIKEIGDLIKNENEDLFEGQEILFHTDAVQAFGLVPINMNELHIDLLSMTGHKINGPKGIGFLYAREGVALTPHLHGGEQERKRRAGTQNVPGIVGLKKSIELVEQTRESKQESYKRFRELILKTLDDRKITYKLNGDLDHHLPHVLNLYFPGTHVESLLMNLDLAGVAVSSGSACTAGSVEPSHVLSAMYGKESKEAKASIRMSFGLYNTDEQMTKAAEILADTVDRLTRMAVHSID
jgi:cysteine desulfurase